MRESVGQRLSFFPASPAPAGRLFSPHPKGHSGPLLLDDHPAPPHLAGYATPVLKAIQASSKTFLKANQAPSWKPPSRSSPSSPHLEGLLLTGAHSIRAGHAGACIPRWVQAIGAGGAAHGLVPGLAPRRNLAGGTVLADPTGIRSVAWGAICGCRAAGRRAVRTVAGRGEGKRGGGRRRRLRL